MADRRVRLILEAQVDRFNANVRQARAEAEGLGSSLKKNVSSQEMQNLGRGMAAFGAATLAGLGVAAKASMDWESAWAGVMKTVEGSPEEMAKLESELRGLALVLPATHTEIAAVAQAAGQLGIGVNDVADFTKVMIDMGESTNMSADQAATSLARFANIMGTSSSDFDRIGSSVVELGNNFATTESEIVDMSMRIAGAGAQLGLTEGEVLGFATALSSVGIEAAAGGSAISRVMIEIAADVDKGGEDLEKWADAAGMSAAEFKRAFEEDAAGAMVSLVDGLGNAEEQGMSTLGMLDELGISEVRTRDAMLRLAGASDLLGDALETGNRGFEENVALLQEAEQRYATAESQIAMAWNGIKDAAIDAGAVIVPALVGVMEGVADLAGWFSDLPGPAQTAITTIGGLVGAAAAAGGGFILLLPKMQESAAALRSLGPGGARAATGIGRAGKAAGIAVVAFLALETASRLAGTGIDDIGSSSEFEMAMLQLQTDSLGGANALDELAASTGSSLTSVKGLGDALDTVNMGGFVKGLDWVGSVGGIFDSEFGLAEEALANYDEALTSLVSAGNLELAAEGFRRAAEEGELHGRSLETVAESFPDYLDGLRQSALENGILLSETELLNWALGELPPQMEAVKAASDAAADQEQFETALEDVGLAADGVVESMADYIDMMLQTGMMTQSVMEAEAAYEAQLRSVDDTVQQLSESLAAEYEAKGMSAEAAMRLASEEVALGAALDKNKTSFDITTEAGYQAQESFLGLADRGRDAARAMAENEASQEDIQGSLGNTYRDLMTAAEGFGMSEEAARALTREVLGVPDGVTIDSWMSEEAQRTAENLRAELDRSDGRITRSSHIHSIITERRSSGNNSGARDLERAFYGQGRQNSGGAVFGAGTGTSDEIPRWLSNGEHVLDARDVQLMGGQSAVYDFRRSLADGSQANRPAGREMQPAYDPGLAQVRELTAVMSSGGATTAGAERPINITGNHFNVDSKLDIRKVSEELAKQVRRDMRAG